MSACISRHDDPAAVGEADIRARALAAGWRHDAIGRLVCPYCQQRNPALWAAYPLAQQHPAPAEGSRQPPAHSRAGRIGAVRTTISALSARRRQVWDDLARRPRWPHLLAALADGGNGSNAATRPRHQRTGPTSQGPAGPGRRRRRRAVAISPATCGGGRPRQQGQQARATSRP